MTTPRRLRVLLYPFHFLPEEWNGIDEHLLLLSRYLDRERYELLVLAHESDGPQTWTLAERAGLRLVEAPYRSGEISRERLGALRALYERERIDLVHFHSPVAGGQAIPAVAARLAGVPATVATFHQIQDRRLSTKSRAVSYVTLSLFVDDIMAVSNGVKETLVRAAGAPRSRITVVHNGIEASETATGASALPRRDGEVLIGYFGRLSPEKGVPGLLEALALLAPRCPQARTVIVGDGPDRALLEAMAVQLGIADRVQFLGFRADARQLMAQVDLVAHVPVYEGFGIVVLEAMAAGRPVVGNDAPGGVSEIVVHADTGLIVPAGSAACLARALAYLVESPHERARLGQNGRARQERHFSARGMVERIEEAYASALRRRAALSHAERVRGMVSSGR